MLCADLVNLQWTENSGNHSALGFKWEVFLLAGKPEDDSTYFGGFAKEQSSGIILLALAALALALANSPLGDAYRALIETPIAISVGGFTLRESLLYWINDGLMVIFFFVVGLEIKHEMQDGALSSWRQASLPVMGAIGGMVLPAAIYVLLARGTAAISGWGIPMAMILITALSILVYLFFNQTHLLRS